MEKLAYFILITLSLIISKTSSAQGLSQDFDKIVSEYYQDDMPGATVLVAKDGKAIYRKAVGKSNLELNVDMKLENVFMLASITKQFTAVAILMLEEQGKLNLNDPITKFIPDYPTHGKTITIHHLLNHTSGIKSYTGIGNLIEIARIDKTLDELIDFFKNEPMDFDPGEEFRYNNSGYVLLGKIIEIISGDTYENYIETEIFEPLEMTNSRYGKNQELVENRVMPYEESDNGFINANYLSMTLPHAAGSLISTVDDLLKWQNALRNNTLINGSTLEKAINGSELNNGEHIPYGYGLAEFELKGSKGYTHSGGIFGTSTNGIYLKEDDVYVIGLSNCSCNDIQSLTEKLAAVAIGKPYPNKDDIITLTNAQKDKWVGAYQFEDGAIRHIYREGNQLKSMRESETNTAFDIFPLSESRFMFNEGNIEYQFSIGADDKRTVVFITNTENKGVEIEKEMPKPRKELVLDEAILKQYVGTYELAPNFNVEITVDGNKIFAQATGQGQFELFAESANSFFAKITALKVVFNKDNDNTVSSFTIFQGGEENIAKKIN